MNRKVKFGIIGCGMIANWHAQAIEAIDDAVLVGVTDNNPESLRSFAGKYGVIDFKSVDSILSSSEVDAVCICTPSGLHAPQAIMAAEAGKHIIVEKPMALTVKAADDIINACSKNNVKVEVISQLRFTPAVRKLKKAADDGLLGRIVTGDIYMKYYRSKEYYGNSGWRGTWSMDGGGALMNQGIHGVDLLRYIMGPVTAIAAYTRTLARDIEVEDTAAAVLEFKSGAIGVIQATTSVYPGYPRRMEINGDKGSIVLEEDAIARWDIEGKEIPEDVVLQATTSKSSSNPSAFSIDGHIMQIKDMVEAIKQDVNPMVDQYEGRKPIEIITAIYESSRTGKIIKLT